MPDPRPPGPPVHADFREPPEIADALRAEGIVVEVKGLQPADFVIGPVAIERKTVGDFASSLYDGRLFDQLQRMRAAYEQVLLVVEGDLAELAEGPNAKALHGALASVALDWEVGVLPATSPLQTAALLAALHRRIGKEPRSYALRHKPRAFTPEQEALIVVQGLPGVGDVLSERLLETFGSARRVMAARESDLLRVPLVGPEKARRILDVLDRPWRSRQRRIEEGG